MFPLRLPGIGRDAFSTLGKGDRKMFGVGLGRLKVTRADQLQPGDIAGISAQLGAIYEVSVQSRLSQIPIGVLFFGGLLSTGKDPNAPPADSGSGFINAIPVLSNGANTIASIVGVEAVRIGYGLNPNQAYPTGSGNTVTLPSNFPTSPLTYLYPGVVSTMDLSFRTATQFGKDVVVGNELGVDGEQTLYKTYPAGSGPSGNLLDDFDTYEHHFVHSYAAINGVYGGISKWNDYDKEYAVFSVFNMPWQRNCRCVINNFMTVDTITVVEWDVNTTWTPNLKQLTKAIKFFQNYPTSIRDPGENP